MTRETYDKKFTKSQLAIWARIKYKNNNQVKLNLKDFCVEYLTAKLM